MRRDNVDILKETLRILTQGSYEINGKTVKLQLSREQMEDSHVLLPADVQNICGRRFPRAYASDNFEIDCVKLDSYVVSDMFYRALKDFEWSGLKTEDIFRRIVFAVRSRGEESYNFREFNRNFGSGNFG